MKHMTIAALLTGLFACTGASANQMFNFEFNIGNNLGYGTLDAQDLGSGDFLAVSGSLTLTSSSDAANVGSYSLLAGGPGNTLSPSGRFSFNDVLHTLSDPVLDTQGLLFTGLGKEINIWGNTDYTYAFYSWDGASYNVADDHMIRSGFYLTPTPAATGPAGPIGTSVPEPASLALFGLGFAALGFTLRKRG